MRCLTKALFKYHYQHICLICTSSRTATYLQPVWIMVFLYATTVSLIKLIFYIKNKKAVDLRLQHRINRNNSFSRKHINVTILVRFYLTSRLKVFCKKGVLRNFSKFTGKHQCWSVFLIKLQAWDLQLY